MQHSLGLKEQGSHESMTLWLTQKGLFHIVIDHAVLTRHKTTVTQGKWSRHILYSLAALMSMWTHHWWCSENSTHNHSIPYIRSLTCDSLQLRDPSASCWLFLHPPECPSVGSAHSQGGTWERSVLAKQWKSSCYNTDCITGYQNTHKIVPPQLL